MKLLFSKGTSLGVQLVLSLAVGVVLMVCDTKYQAFKIVRYYLDTLVSPLYYISDSPRGAFESMLEMKKSRDTLMADNTALRHELFLKNNDLLLLSQLQHENNRLRELLGSPLRGDEYKMATQVLLINSRPYAYQVVLNKGTRDSVYIGQPLIDEKGIVGQIFATSKTTSRAILICDYQHSIPVQILRNDMLMVAVGNGCSNNLILDFLPNNVDIKVGDKLVTSGLDGHFPEGYPVAMVTSVDVDPHSGNLIVEATPTADLKRLRYLLLLWDDSRLAIKDQNSALELKRFNKKASLNEDDQLSWEEDE